MGVAMRLDSAQAFMEHSLGAIQDNKLVEAIGHRIGEQAKRLGVHINFAPDVDSIQILKILSLGIALLERKENVTQKLLL